MIESALLRFPDHETDISDMSSGVYAWIMSIGYLMGPLYGSTVNAYLGFKLTMDIIAFIDLAFAILYFTFAGGFSAFKITYNNFKTIQNTDSNIDSK